MANSRISALPAASTPLAGTEVLPIVQGGITEQVSVANLTAGRAVSAASLSFTGQMNAAFGSVSAPSIYFGTSTTTGFYRPSSTTVGIAAGGVSAATFDATSASVAGGLTGGSGYQVSGFTSYRASGASASSPGDASMYFNSATGQTFQARAGSSYDWSLINPGNASYIARVPTGTLNFELAGGNLAFSTSGKGIDFSATSGTGTSELLADYEEGTWTPTYTPASGAFGAITYNANTFGRYTKVGNAVFIVGLIITDSFAVGTGSGQGRISGLPFTPSPSASASINYSTNFNLDTPTGSFTSGTDIFLTSRLTSNGSSTTFNSANFTTGASAFANYVYFQMNFVV
jgi:hypothetical protein